MLYFMSGLIQFMIFVLSALYFSAHAASDNPPLKRAILIGLLLNPFLLAHVTDGLTEGLTVPIVLVMTGLGVIAISDPQRFNMRAMVCGAILGAAIVMIRPSNLVVLGAWCVGLTMALLLHQRPSQQKATDIGKIVASIAIATALLWTPQLVYNYINWHVVSIMPICQLGDLQLRFGIVSWRYDTVIIDGKTATSLFTSNPFIREALPIGTPAWKWYFYNPIAGSITIFAHIFNSFDMKYLFTYVHTTESLLRRPLSFLGWIVFLAGALKGVQCIWRALLGRHELSPSHIFIVSSGLCVFLGSVALNSVIAVEPRFNILPIGILSILAVYGFSTLPIVRSAFILIPIICLAFVLTLVSEEMKKLEVASLGNKTPTFVGTQTCLSSGHWREFCKRAAAEGEANSLCSAVAQ